MAAAVHALLFVEIVYGKVEDMGRARAFDDVFSWLHFFVSLLISILSPLASIAATLVFIEYQRWERERRSEKLGDFIEWLAGILFGVILRSILLGA